MYAYILVGLPGSGKSTFRSFLTKMHPHRGFRIISLDDYIDWYAKKNRITYTEAFAKPEVLSEAEARCNREFKMAISMRQPVIIDRTNLSKKSREKWLKDIPKNYRKTAVVMKEISEEEHQERLNRPGKDIPKSVLEKMKQSFEYPSQSEGFDIVYEWPQEIELDETELG